MVNKLKGVGTLAICCNFSVIAFAQAAPAFDFKPGSSYFTGLREAYAKAQPGWISWAADPERENLMNLYDEKAPEKFLKLAPVWLVKCPVDARAQIMTATLCARVGRYEDSIRHRNMYYGLLASIVNSGDGKSAATAFKVISINEEYTLLNYMGAELKKQSLQGMCDVMEVIIEGQPVTLYFDVSIHLRAMQREFEAANAK